MSERVLQFRGQDERRYEVRGLEQRYDKPDILGFQAWTEFIGAIRSINGIENLARAFEHFQTQARQDERPSLNRLFISHQFKDGQLAERIAWLSCRAGMDYWLDVHDPVLILFNKIVSPKNPKYAFILAAIVEMALLNTTHVIAVHTPNSQSSKWVPYELGRTKQKNLLGDNAGGWCDPTLPSVSVVEYVVLCKVAKGGESAVDQWLRYWRGPASPLGWPFPTVPGRLPP